MNWAMKLWAIWIKVGKSAMTTDIAMCKRYDIMDIVLIISTICTITEDTRLSVLSLIDTHKPVSGFLK